MTVVRSLSADTLQGQPNTCFLLEQQQQKSPLLPRLLSACSEELQLPPELKAYLEELEAQEHGGHSGGWVHSGIAERLSSSDDFSGLE